MTIDGYVLDALTGEAIPFSDVSLTQHDVLGQELTRADDKGRFVFGPLAAGRYNLGVHADRYVHVYRDFAIEDGQNPDSLRISVIPGAFLEGQVLDEDGDPPYRCYWTLIREGTRRGQRGYISDSGDHRVSSDGHFSSPSLSPGEYFIRFAGVLKKPQGNSDTPESFRSRIFDFVYPNARTIKEALSFRLQTGEMKSDLIVQIPRPVWHKVRGKVLGELPPDLGSISVHFLRNVGMLDNFGSSGSPLQADRTFEGDAQPGHYDLHVWQMESLADGFSRGLKEFGSSKVTVEDHDMDDVEIVLSPTS